MSAITFLLLVAAADWPGFRGTGDGIHPSKTLPTAWSPTENIAWTIDLPGYGQSSSVVWKGRVYITAVAGAQRDKGHIAAYDAVTGKKAWQHDFEPTQKAKWGDYISRAAPTPAVDAAGVYCFFEGGNLIALTHEGKVRWERSLVKEFGEFKNGHGLAGSPAQDADTLYVLIDHRAPSYLLAVDKKTGKDRWKADRTERSSWTSPVIVGKQVVVSSGGTVAGYAMTDGKKLWEIDGLQGNTLPSATPAPGGIVVGAGLGQRGGDAEKSAQSNTFVKMTDDGKAERGWKASKAVTSYMSPLVYEGHVYLVNTVGVLFCLDVKTGEEKYAQRIDGPSWATPIAADGRIYFFGRNGTTTVVKAGPKFEKVASHKLWEPASKKDETKTEGRGEMSLDPIIYGVAADNTAFYVRTGTKLFRIGKP